MIKSRIAKNLAIKAKRKDRLNLVEKLRYLNIIWSVAIAAISGNTSLSFTPASSPLRSSERINYRLVNNDGFTIKSANYGDEIFIYSISWK